MNKLGSAIVSSGVAGLPDLHLMFGSDDSQIATLLYVPESSRPALSLDVLRVDRLSRSPLDLDAVLSSWREGFTRYAGGVDVELDVPRRSETEILAHAHFRSHPMFAANDTMIRYVRADEGDYPLQFIRKFDALTPDEARQRMAFLDSAALAPEAFSAASRQYTDFAVAAQTRSDQIYQLMQRGELATLAQRTFAEYIVILEGASPFHHPEICALLAVAAGRNALAEGRIDDLEIAVKYVRLALMTMLDAGPTGPFRNVYRRAISDLANLLMYMYSSARAENVVSAARLYALAAKLSWPSHPEEALAAEVMLAVASLVRQPDSQAPLESALPPMARRALQHKQGTIDSAELLLGYVRRTAYVARRKDLRLFNDACLAADLMQVLVERGGSEGILDFQESTSWLLEAFQAQLNAQLGLHGWTQKDLDEGTTAFAARYRKDTPPLSLVYLRPLAAARRIWLRNRFGPYYRPLLATMRYVSEEITLEAALHIAFAARFGTQALGGPIDMFGMGRATAFGKQRSYLAAWQEAVRPMIAHADVLAVLLDESDGLLWELSEVANQRAFTKLILIVPPGERAPRRRALSPAGAQRLRDIGFDLPTGPDAEGFLLLDASGRVETQLEFEALWSGQLLEAVLDRVQRGGPEPIDA